jgi:hypothetical protein
MPERFRLQGDLPRAGGLSGLYFLTSLGNHKTLSVSHKPCQTSTPSLNSEFP